MSPRLLLHLEGAAMLMVSLILYHSTHASWLQFTLLFLLPDISMLGYAINARVGSISYNAVHSYIAPLIWAAWCLGTNHSAVLALIWIAHIAFDRLLGYGLKYPTDFKETHLNPVRHALKKVS